MRFDHNACGAGIALESLLVQPLNGAEAVDAVLRSQQQEKAKLTAKEVKFQEIEYGF